MSQARTFGLVPTSWQRTRLLEGLRRPNHESLDAHEIMPTIPAQLLAEAHALRSTNLPDRPDFQWREWMCHSLPLIPRCPRR